MLAPCTRVGPYEILSLIGEGGMGEVYKARDTRLDRLVAIKFAQLRFNERFEREARAVAALNHPNICQIHDIGPDYLVMEYVDGARLEGVESIRRLLDIAVQLADGLAAAHAAGFIHRDLKPDNVLITHDGRVKILDFGVAKHLMAAPGDATLSMTSTAPGRVVGTASYMSPEQARGRELDARSDQFALGLILYRLASGAHPFQRASAAETMAAIIHDEAPPLPPGVPAPLRWIIERCLAKDPADRYESTRDLYQELRTVRDHLSETSMSAATADETRHWTRRAWVTAATGTAAVAAGGAAGALWERLRTGAPPLWSGRMLAGPAFAMAPRLSPDGQLLAFVGMTDEQTQVGVMKPDAGSWRILTDQTDAGAVLNVAWAPDGSRLYFDRYWDKARGVYMIPPLGGEPALVLENAAAPLPLPDGSIVALKSSPGVRDQMYRFWPSTGRLQALPAFVIFWRLTGAMRAVPDGSAVVFFRAGDGSGSALCALELASGRIRTLAPELRFEYQQGEVIAAAVSGDSRAVLIGFRSEDTYRVLSIPLDGSRSHSVLMALPASSALWHLDLARDGSVYLDQVSRPRALLRFSGAGASAEEAALPALAVQSIMALDDGRIVFTGLEAGRRHLMIARPGNEPRRFLPLTDESSAPFAHVGAGALAFLAGEAARSRIALASLRDGHVIRQLSFDAGQVHSLVASPDGGVLYYTDGNGVWSAPADGSAGPRRIGDGTFVTVEPRGRFLYVIDVGSDPIRLLRLPLRGGAPQPIAIPEHLRLAAQDFGSNAIDERGRLLLTMQSRDSWFYSLVIFDGERGSFALAPARYRGGLGSASWTADGRIVALGVGLASTLWRYRTAP